MDHYKVIESRNTQHGYVEHDAMFGLPGDKATMKDCKRWLKDIAGGKLLRFGQIWNLSIVPYNHPTTPFPEFAYMDE